MSLSVATPTHLKEIGLLPDFVDQASKNDPLSFFWKLFELHVYKLDNYHIFINRLACKAPRTGGGGLCEHECSSDSNCHKGLRCCKNGCGSLCALEEPSSRWLQSK